MHVQFVATAIVLVALLQGQTTRLQGRVTNESGGPIAGVEVTVSECGAARSVVTDAHGQYAVEVNAFDTPCTVRVAAPGFVTVFRNGVIVRPNESTVVDVTIGSCPIYQLGVEPLLDRFLTADAVVHLRITSAATELHQVDPHPCEPDYQASADVIEVIRTSRSWTVPGSLSIVSSRQLERGQEYVAIVGRNQERGWIGLDDYHSILVEHGRVEKVDDLGVPDGTPIGEAVRRLQDFARRQTRYRTYENLKSAAPFETLRHRTGWVQFGYRVAGQWQNKPDENDHEPWFEALGAASTDGLPRRGGRIRLKQDMDVYIQDFGSRGESQRLRRPTSLDDLFHINSLTGVFAGVGEEYRVEDVTVFGGETTGSGDGFVWVRIAPVRR